MRFSKKWRNSNCRYFRMVHTRGRHYALDCVSQSPSYVAISQAPRTALAAVLFLLKGCNLTMQHDCIINIKHDITLFYSLWFSIQVVLLFFIIKFKISKIKYINIISHNLSQQSQTIKFIVSI